MHTTGEKTRIRALILRSSQPVHKAALRICEPHFVHKGAQACERARLNINEYTTSPELKIDKMGGVQNAGCT
jgi:hypothetical protein